MDENKSFLRQEDFDKQQTIDQTLLISDLSHQLESLRQEVEALKTLGRDQGLLITRLEGARDTLKDLLLEVMKKR